MLTLYSKKPWWLALLLMTSPLMAETVYKTVDEAGNISYSSTPPENTVNTEPVQLTPAPAQEDVEAAKARADAVKNLASEMERIRKQKEEEREKEKQARPISPPEPVIIHQEPTYYPAYPYYRRPYYGRPRPRYRHIPYNAPEGYEEHPIYQQGIWPGPTHKPRKLPHAKNP